MRETAERDLAASGSVLLHVLLGEATFALRLLKSTGKLPPQGPAVLNRLIQELSLSTEAVRTTHFAVGNLDRFDLAVAANSAFSTTQLDGLDDQLTETATRLKAILDDPAQSAADDVDKAVGVLRQLEDAVAAMDALPTDEVIIGDGWSR